MNVDTFIYHLMHITSQNHLHAQYNLGFINYFSLAAILHNPEVMILEYKYKTSTHF